MKVWSILVWCVSAAMISAAAGCDPQPGASRTTVSSIVETAPSVVSSAPTAAAPSASPSASVAPSSIPLLDFSTLAKDAPSLSGKRVRVIGEVYQGSFQLRKEPDGSLTLAAPSQTCTQKECVDGTSCCNRCASAVSLRGNPLMGVRLVDKANPTRYSCGGNECSMTCTPAKGGQYEAIGIFRFGPNGELDLEVDSIRPLP